jgi:hypothetical protein
VTVADLLFEEPPKPSLEERVRMAGAQAPVVFAVDPGPGRSAYVIFSRTNPEDPILDYGILENEALLSKLRAGPLARADKAIFIAEQIEAMGMAVGREVFETVYWTGRFLEAWVSSTGHPADRLPRRAVKLQLCGTCQAKDPNIRQALIDRFGPPGTKKAPGKTYGIKEDLWSALAVAVTWVERERERAEF